MDEADIQSYHYIIENPSGNQYHNDDRMDKKDDDYPFRPFYWTHFSHDFHLRYDFLLASWAPFLEKQDLHFRP